MRKELYPHMKRHPIAEAFASMSEDVLERFEGLSPYAAGQHAWRKRAEWLDAAGRPQADRKAVAEAVIQYNRKHNHIPEALANAEKLADPSTLVVVGGQQAGLFTGPMLVIYKVFTLLNTAKYAEKLLGRTVVPIFWIAGEDHDWDEVNHTYVVTPQLEVKKVAIEHPEPLKRTSVSRTFLSPEAWNEPLEALAEALPDTEFKPQVMDELRRITAESSSLSDAFAKIISLFFGKHGLVLIDSDDAALRKAEAPLFVDLIRNQAELVTALKTGERAVAEAGYPLQAEASERGFQLFLFHEGERKLLYLDGGNAVDRKGTLSIPRSDLEKLAQEHPEQFSNNALTRPLMQEYLFPTLATVLGPSEIAYWSTLREAFRAFGMRTPVIVPRQEFTLLEGTVQKQMEKFGVTFAEAWEQLEEKRDEWLRDQDALGLEDRFAQVRSAFTELYSPLVETIAQVNPGLRKLGETNMGKIVEQIDFLEKRSTDAFKQQHEAGLRHWERIRTAVSPAGKAQERVVNVFQYVSRYGFPWMDELLAAGTIDFEQYRSHEVIYL